MIERIGKWIDKLSDYGAYLSSVFMIFIVALILFEIFLRTFFHTSTLISDEFSAYFFVSVVMLGLSYTFKENGHIRITLVLSRLSKKTEKVFDIITSCIALVLTSFMFYHSLRMVIDTYKLDMRADSIAETPLFIPEIALPIGFFLFMLQILFKIIGRIRK
jgi:TRAP-type C4-dicarboxylate transport system permease small subunit